MRAGGVRVSFVVHVCARSSEHEGGSVNNNNYVDEREERREEAYVISQRSLNPSNEYFMSCITHIPKMTESRRVPMRRGPTRSW